MITMACVESFGATLFWTSLSVSAGVLITLTVGSFTRPYYEAKRRARQRGEGVE